MFAQGAAVSWAEGQWATSPIGHCRRPVSCRASCVRLVPIPLSVLAYSGVDLRGETRAKIACVMRRAIGWRKWGLIAEDDPLREVIFCYS